MNSVTRQLAIIHLSDIHFGPSHRFSPVATAAGDIPPEPDYPTLLGKLVADLATNDPGCPVLVAVTGDMAQTASYEEFKQAEQFVRDLASADIYGPPRGLESMFWVPGNH